MSFMDSPFIVPVAGCIMILGLGSFGIYSEIAKNRLRSQERLTMVARGASTAEIEAYMAATREEEEKPLRDPLRSLARTRRVTTVLLSVGVGVILFGLMVAAIVHEHEALIISALGVVDMAIGFGFLADYNMQKRDLSRFGMEVDAPVMLERPS